MDFNWLFAIILVLYKISWTIFYNLWHFMSYVLFLEYYIQLGFNQTTLRLTESFYTIYSINLFHDYFWNIYCMSIEFIKNAYKHNFLSIVLWCESSSVPPLQEVYSNTTFLAWAWCHFRYSNPSNLHLVLSQQLQP